MPDEERQQSIWLEVANVRLENKKVEIQVKGDRADHQPVWWEVELDQAGFSEAVPAKSGHNEAYRTIADGLDKKKIVLAKLAPVLSQSTSSTETQLTLLKCTSIRIQYSESNNR